MLQFILTDILMISLGTLLYLAARALPRVEEEPSGKPNIFERWAASGIPERLDAVINSFLLKLLRKLKVLILKADNSVTTHLKRVTPNGNGGMNGKPKIDFKDIVNSEDTVEKNSKSGDN